MLSETCINHHERRVNSRFLSAALWCVVSSCAFATAEALGPGQFENLARGAANTLQPAPAYQYCTDPGDTTQLTDGAYVDGYFWTQPGTVGWQNAKPVVVTVDLGEVKSIRGVSFNTAAGTAGVAWPASIGLYVADEPGAFHRVGDLVSLSAVHGAPPAEGYAVHRYWTDALQTHGRYVAFAVLNVPFIFADEVEVYAGEPGWNAAALPGIGVPDVAADVAQLQGEAFVRRRLADDLGMIRTAIATAELPPDAAAALNERLEAIATRVAAHTPEYGPGFRAVLPLDSLHAEIFQLQAALWRAQGLPEMVVWQSPLWDFLGHLATPNPGATPALEVHLMRNEHRAAAFNISNASEAPLTVSLTLSNLPPGANAGTIRVHEVAWTDTNAGVPVAAALPDAAREGDGYRITVPSGMTRQIWLTLNSRGLSPGTHEARMTVAGGGADTQLPLVLHVYAPAMNLPRLHFGGWDYTNTDSQYGLTPQNREKLIDILQEYHVDSPWATAQVMPWGEYDSAGNMTQEPDPAAFDAWIDRWPNARKFCVFLAVTPTTLPFPPGSDAFNQAIRDWCAFWSRQMRAVNARPQHSLYLLLVDEPSEPEQQDLVTDWGYAIERSASGINVWEDPVYRSAAAADPAMIEVCDVLCPNRQIFHQANEEYRDFFVKNRPEHVELEFYSCSGPVRLLDPYGYHRLQAWDCWRYGAKATFFWAFADSGGASSWNEYAAERAAYTPLFIDDTSVTTGKHLESCREGLQDYETLSMLEQALRDARSANAHGEWAARVEQFLLHRPAEVAGKGYLDSVQWKDEVDRTLADQVRIEALELLAEVAGE